MFKNARKVILLFLLVGLFLTNLNFVYAENTEEAPETKQENHVYLLEMPENVPSTPYIYIKLEDIDDISVNQHCGEVREATYLENLHLSVLKLARTEANCRVVISTTRTDVPLYYVSDKSISKIEDIRGWYQGYPIDERDIDKGIALKKEAQPLRTLPEDKIQLGDNQTQTTTTSSEQNLSVRELKELREKEEAKQRFIKISIVIFIFFVALTTLLIVLIKSFFSNRDRSLI